MKRDGSGDIPLSAQHLKIFFGHLKSFYELEIANRKFVCCLCHKVPQFPHHT